MSTELDYISSDRQQRQISYSLQHSRDNHQGDDVIALIMDMKLVSEELKFINHFHNSLFEEILSTASC